MGLFDSLFKSKAAPSQERILELFPGLDFENRPEDQFHASPPSVVEDEVEMDYVRFMEDEPLCGIFTYCKVTKFKTGDWNINFTSDAPSAVKIQDVEKFVNMMGELLGPDRSKAGETRFTPTDRRMLEDGFWVGRTYDKSGGRVGYVSFYMMGTEYMLHIKMSKSKT